MRVFAVRRYSWAEVVELSEGLADLVGESFAPTMIVAVFRGGAFPALIISHRLGIGAMHAVRVTTMTTERARSPRRPPVINGVPGLPDMRDERVLIVDDVVNTGDTLRCAVKEITLRCRPRRIATACLVWDTVTQADGDVLSICPADYHADSVAAWVGFPWEVPDG